MAKRIITIIIILLAVFFLTMGGVWLVGRHQAQKNNMTPLTFREFLGLSTKKSPAKTVPGTLTSTFTNSTGPSDSTPANNGTLGQGTLNTGSVNPSSFATQVSQFTNEPLSPGNGIANGGTIGAAGGINSGNGGNTQNSGPISLNNAIGSGLGGSSCSAADSTITFTADEIQQLNALQTQYNTIAANLSTNDDVASELSTYNGYKLEEGKITEMQNFCQSTTPFLNDPVMQRHVPTPFWHVTNQDSETFSAGGINSTADSTNPASGESFLERILRINLW